jgi:hypothetical protein
MSMPEVPLRNCGEAGTAPMARMRLEATPHLLVHPRGGDAVLFVEVFFQALGG